MISPTVLADGFVGVRGDVTVTLRTVVYGVVGERDVFVVSEFVGWWVRHRFSEDQHRERPRLSPGPINTVPCRSNFKKTMERRPSASRSNRIFILSYSSPYYFYIIQLDMCEKRLLENRGLSRSAIVWGPRPAYLTRSWGELGRDATPANVGLILEIGIWSRHDPGGLLNHAIPRYSAHMH